jgi:mono/diheme cytochrome c family protein
MVLLLSVGFAALQNPSTAAAPAPTTISATPDTAAGRRVYDANGCAACHAVAGQGNPRSPLDGIGSRLGSEEIRQWIVGDEAVQDDLSPRALKAKREYAALPAADLDALVAYLQALVESP